MPVTQFHIISLFPVLELPSLAFATAALEGWGLWGWYKSDKQKNIKISDDIASSNQREGNAWVESESMLATTR